MNPDEFLTASSHQPYVLRPYQEEAVQSIFDYFDRRKGNPLVVAPTGSGKSLLIAEFIRRALEYYPGTRIMMATHVKELIEQNHDKLRGLAPSVYAKSGIYSAGIGRRQHRAQVLYCGVQSVYKICDKIGHVDLMLVDEAHLIPHSGDGRYRRLIEGLKEINPALKVVGFTATPFRTDDGLLTEGKGHIFSSVCYNIDLVQLLDDGYLCNLISEQGAVSYDTSKVSTRAGDFAKGELAAAIADQDDVTLAAVEEAMHQGIDRKSWLFFCASVAQAEVVTSYIKAQDFSVALVTGTTRKSERERVVREFRANRIRAVVNVGVFTTGFDAPCVDMIVLLRPTKSPGLYVQCIGRGLRVDPGKKDCLVLDFGDNVARHGPINDVQIPPPKGDGKGEMPTKTCPQCFFSENPAGVRHCLECGFEFAKPEPELTKASFKGAIVQRVERQWYDITRVKYARHKKDGKPDSVRVDYFSGIVRIASEFICPEHGGWAADKAYFWLGERLEPGVFVDDSNGVKGVDYFLHVSEKLKVPSKILLDQTSKHSQILRTGWDDCDV